jgi:hypothetical protein
VIIVAVHINRYAVVIGKILSGWTLLMNTVAAVVQTIVNHATRAITESISGIAVTGKWNALVTDVAVELRTIYCYRNAIESIRIQSIKKRAGCADEFIGIVLAAMRRIVNA